LVNLEDAPGRDVDEGPRNTLNDRDAEVVRIIEEEGLSVFTFDGLRRITGTHPETLSRALDRLEDEGMIVRSPEGYSTTGKAKETVQMQPASTTGKRVPILHTFLPYGSSLNIIVSALRGRWFDRMRWVGIAESEGSVVMKWVTDDGSALIGARFSSGQLDIEARIRKDSDLPGAVRAAHQLIGRISKMYASSRPGARPSLMQIGYFATLAM
jgi:DNA-binding transcriptional ArsR family regulator